MKPRAPIKRRRTKPRRGPMRCKAYRDWLKWHVCVANVMHRLSDYPTGGLNCDPAHTQNNGMSSKGPDSSCAPLCRRHHREYDAGRKSFEAKYSVDMSALAAAHWKRFCEETGFKENEK